MKLAWITSLSVLALFTHVLVAETTPPPRQPPAKEGAAVEEVDNCPRRAGMQKRAGMRRGQVGGQEMHQGRGCGKAGGHGHGQARANGRGRGRGMGRGNGPRGNMADHAMIHSLMADHAAVKRQVIDVPKGVRTETTSEDPEVAAAIRTHVRQMAARLESGQPIRMFDPLFRELFAHAEKIDMKIEDIPGGARVIETSDDPKVMLLIRQHARAVTGFVAEGMAKMHEPTPLPEGYDPQ